MRLYIIAGEASGDLHGANLVKAFNELHPDIEWRGWGGDRMVKEGVSLKKHIRDLAFMGFAEVVMNLKTILGNLSACKADIKDFKPDAVILIDYPGFNLRIAPYVKSLGIPVHYYISPQIWAWKSNRVHAIKKYTDRVYCILPFEKDFYGSYGVDVDFVGHPLLDELKDGPSLEKGDKPTIALLPGSRKQEISKMLPAMLSMVKEFPNYRFKIAAAPSIDLSYYKAIIGKRDVDLVEASTYALLRSSHAALVTSGTATLETALLGVPEIVCYRGNPISYTIARQVVKVKYISLVNLIMDAEVVKELIQSDLNSSRLKTELRRIVENGPDREAMKASYLRLKAKLGGPGASERAARLMLERISIS
jgi:lipid-A-disaccharide synthase